METSSHIISFCKVTKKFGSQVVLDELDLDIPRGKLTFVIGRSGEGKSVILKHIVGILHPDAGDLFFDGENVTSQNPDKWCVLRKKVGILFQDGALFDSMTVAENVGLGLCEFTSLRGAALAQKVAELLERVGLGGIEARFPHELSIGEKKRVGLARALALDPQVLLYDEPTTSMDPLVSELIDDLIVETHASRGPGVFTSVVVSHDVASVLRVAEHVIMLHRGKVFFAGSPRDLAGSADPLLHQFLTGASHGPLNAAL